MPPEPAISVPDSQDLLGLAPLLTAYLARELPGQHCPAYPGYTATIDCRIPDQQMPPFTQPCNRYTPRMAPKVGLAVLLNSMSLLSCIGSSHASGLTCCGG